MTSRQNAPASFAWGAGAAFLTQGLGLLLTWITQVALARLLPHAEFGLYTTVAALAATLAVPATLGLPVAMVRFLPEYRARSDWQRYVGVLRGGQALTLTAGLLGASVAVLVVWLAPGSPMTDGRAAFLLGAALIPALALSTLGLETLRGMGRVAQATGRRCCFSLP